MIKFSRKRKRKSKDDIPGNDSEETESVEPEEFQDEDTGQRQLPRVKLKRRILGGARTQHGRHKVPSRVLCIIREILYVTLASNIGCVDRVAAQTADLLTSAASLLPLDFIRATQEVLKKNHNGHDRGKLFAIRLLRQVTAALPPFPREFLIQDQARLRLAPLELAALTISRNRNDAQNALSELNSYLVKEPYQSDALYQALVGLLHFVKTKARDDEASFQSTDSTQLAGGNESLYEAREHFEIALQIQRDNDLYFLMCYEVTRLLKRSKDLLRLTRNFVDENPGSLIGLETLLELLRSNLLSDEEKQSENPLQIAQNLVKRDPHNLKGIQYLVSQLQQHPENEEIAQLLFETCYERLARTPCDEFCWSILSDLFASHPHFDPSPLPKRWWLDQQFKLAIFPFSQAKTNVEQKLIRTKLL